MVIQNNLIELRGSTNQQEVADGAKISRQTLSRLESGKLLPKKKNADLLASYFGKPVTFIVQPPEK